MYDLYYPTLSFCLKTPLNRSFLETNSFVFFIINAWFQGWQYFSNFDSTLVLPFHIKPTRDHFLHKILSLSCKAGNIKTLISKFRKNLASSRLLAPICSQWVSSKKYLDSLTFRLRYSGNYTFTILPCILSTQWYALTKTQ